MCNPASAQYGFVKACVAAAANVRAVGGANGRAVGRGAEAAATNVGHADVARRAPSRSAPGTLRVPVLSKLIWRPGEPVEPVAGRASSPLSR